MKKPLKYHQTLNLPPRSAKHGQHRRPGKASHGNSIVGTDHGAGGSDQSGTVSFWSSGRTITWIDPVFPEPTPPAIPYAGIRTGELIGHRLWWVIGGDLCSLAHRRLWLPGETIHGETNKSVDRDWLFVNVIWGGTYAFAERALLTAEIKIQTDHMAAVRERMAAGATWSPWSWHPLQETETLVSGTIKMWGDVVEHERGYRAEFAKLNGIDEIYGPGDLDALREKYGVSHTSTI